MEQKSETEDTSPQTFYDRIADVQNLMMKINGYRDSVADYLRSLNLNLNPESLVLDAGSGTGILTLGFYTAGFRPKKPSRSIYLLIRSKFLALNLKKTRRRTLKISAPFREMF